MCTSMHFCGKKENGRTFMITFVLPRLGLSGLQLVVGGVLLESAIANCVSGGRL